MKNIKRQLDQYIEESLYYYDLPGLAVLVKNDQMNYVKAVGYKDFTKKEPLKEEHIFHMASVSKLFTASAILHLQEQGVLSLSDKLKDLLPYIKIADRRFDEIEILHMLTHTSGLDDVDSYGWDHPRTDDLALKTYGQSAEVTDRRLLWSPQENKFRYSNMAYELLGLVISEVSGMSFESYIEKYIFEPLGMKDATFLTGERAKGSLKLEDLSNAGMAMPHTKDDENHILLENCYPYNREHAPSSTLTAHVGDLSKWGNAHLSRSFFSEETYDAMWKAYTTVPNNKEGMGLGWFMRKQEGYDLYGHEGNDDGFRASFWICPELNTQVIVVCNILKAPAKKINKKLFELVTHS